MLGPGLALFLARLMWDGGTQSPSIEKMCIRDSADASADYKVQMVTDMGGVNDQSFNQLAWEGLQPVSYTHLDVYKRQVQVIASTLQSIVVGREVLVSALVSQVISNVPAAIMLSGFSKMCIRDSIDSVPSWWKATMSAASMNGSPRYSAMRRAVKYSPRLTSSSVV